MNPTFTKGDHKMPFNRRVPYGLADLKTWVTEQIEKAKITVQSWCDEKFSLLSHTHIDYANNDHKHTISDVNSLQSTLEGKAATNHTHSTYAAKTHTHSQSDVTGLVTDLAGKADSNHIHTEYAAASSVGYIDWSQAVIIRSRNDAAIYTTKWQSKSAYDIKINGSVVCSISAATKDLPGYASVGATSGQYTRCITIMKRGLLMVTDGSHGVGYCKRGNSSWTPIPLSMDSYPGSISMDVFANDKVMVRSGEGLSSELDPTCIVYAPWVQS